MTGNSEIPMIDSHSPTRPFRDLVFACILILGVCAVADAADEVLPHKQTKPPNKPYSPAEAVARMKVPEGFTVEVVAAEPDLVNPVAMTFDERGRIWVTESLEYPRKTAGRGRDRVKILEDADGDGTAERVSIFLDGLNIPSGIAVGHGGVWIANAPDILFVPDADRDGVADGPPQVVVTGFGRDDTHELPNSLTWGPDGWLYGLNGVFNPSHVEQNGRRFDFTCALFRIHPRTREFQLFCEGTSNPWGVAFNDVGDAFVSACVIDHLWHLTETGYYHRQGGPYPPHTWKLGSIVDYKHQMAAYCGIHWFDGDAYPEPYRRKLYMGNIHGGCINVDRLERNGATYRGRAEPDFLAADDVWFMPVVQKTGPDGCLYILDWYDRYHCYQDANRDPAGIDRLKGRLYRVRYKNTPRAPKFDLAAESDDQLIARLASPNIFYREIAQRLLAQRSAPATRKRLEAIVSDDAAALTTRMHALWSLVGGGELDEAFHLRLLEAKEPALRAWGVRAAGNFRSRSASIRAAVAQAAAGGSPDETLQAVIAAAKLFDADAAVDVMLGGARVADPILPNIVWQNLLGALPRSPEYVLTRSAELATSASPGSSALLVPRVIDYLLDQGDAGTRVTVSFLKRELGRGDAQRSKVAYDSLAAIAEMLHAGELAGPREAALDALTPELTPIVADSQEHPLKLPAASILSRKRNAAAVAYVRSLALAPTAPTSARAAALDAWISSGDTTLVDSLDSLLSASATTDAARFRRHVFDALTRSNSADVARRVLAVYPRLEDDLKPAAVELLTSRVAWSNQLLDAVADGRVSKDAVNVNQLRKLLKTGDKNLAKRVEQTWGALRADRNPAREQVVAAIRKLLVESPPGDPRAGQVVFTRLCGQCHKIHGAGQDVGPDITVNGRASLEQLLSNVFDPSLVIGNAYRARTVTTSDGRVLTGLLVEEGPQRIVLKLQGGKLETIARSDVEEIEISRLSLMPEGVEAQYKPQEIIDLFAFLKLDKPPTDPQAKPLPNFGELK